jgi:hypothetical protein
MIIAHKIGPISVAGTASGCMRWLGGTTPEVRDHLPDGIAREGAAWDGVRMRFFPALTGVMTVGCAACDTVRGRCPRRRSHHDGGRMRAVGMAPEGAPRAGLSRHCMRALRPRADARFAQVGDRAAAITGLNRTLASPHSGYSCPPNALRISRAAE